MNPPGDAVDCLGHAVEHFVEREIRFFRLINRIEEEPRWTIAGFPAFEYCPSGLAKRLLDAPFCGRYFAGSPEIWRLALGHRRAQSSPAKRRQNVG